MLQVGIEDEVGTASSTSSSSRKRQRTTQANADEHMERMITILSGLASTFSKIADKLVGEGYES